jgi:hypothetical protein
MIVQQALVTLPHSVYEPDTDQVINMSTLNRPIFRIFPQIRRGCRLEFVSKTRQLTKIRHLKINALRTSGPKLRERRN